MILISLLIQWASCTRFYYFSFLGRGLFEVHVIRTWPQPFSLTDVHTLPCSLPIAPTPLTWIIMISVNSWGCVVPQRPSRLRDRWNEWWKSALAKYRVSRTSQTPGHTRSWRRGLDTPRQSKCSKSVLVQVEYWYTYKSKLIHLQVKTDTRTSQNWYTYRSKLIHVQVKHWYTYKSKLIHVQVETDTRTSQNWYTYKSKLIHVQVEHWYTYK